MTRTLAVIFLAASAATAQAQGLTRGANADTLTLNDGARVAIPHCEDAQGRRVRFTMTRGGAAAPMQPSSGGWSIVSVFTPVNGPQVLMTPDFLAMPYETAQFTVEHECHHHASGDLYSAYMAALTGGAAPDVLNMEFRADCAAAAAVRDKFGFTADDIRAAFKPFPQHNGTATHPATAERVRRAISCLSAP